MCDVIKRKEKNIFVYLFFSAGIGRTGTYIALDILIEHGKQLGYIDAAACVETLRRQRVNMIQNLVLSVFLRYVFHVCLPVFTFVKQTNVN